MYPLINVKIAFANRRLERLYREGKDARKYPKQVYEAFLDAVTLIQAVANEAELYAYKGLRVEKLKHHPRAGYSIRMNRQFRLIFNIQRDLEGNVIIVDVEDYH